MARCAKDIMFPTTKAKAISTDMQLFFTILDNNISCVQINTKDHIDAQADKVTYNDGTIPEDTLNCNPDVCINTGTLDLAGGVNAEVSATFQKYANTNDFYAGVAAYYVYIKTPGTYEFNAQIADYNDTAFANSDIYTFTRKFDHAGWYPIHVDFSIAPTSVTGTGWQASELGFVLKLSAKDTDDKAATDVGFSSISMFDEIGDLVTNDTVVASCISGLEGDITLATQKVTCGATGFDTSALSFEKTFTAGKVSENYYRLNPLAGREKDGETVVMATKKVTLKETTINGKKYAYAQFSDMDLTNCEGTIAVLNDQCNQKYFDRVSTDTLLDVDDNQYFVMNDDYGTQYHGMFLFNDDMVGKEILFGYPKLVDAKEIDVNVNNVGETRVKVRASVPMENGDTIQWEYPDVYMTSFPETVDQNETTYAFKFVLGEDKEGNYAKVFKIKNSNAA